MGKEWYIINLLMEREVKGLKMFVPAQGKNSDYQIVIVNDILQEIQRYTKR